MIHQVVFGDAVEPGRKTRPPTVKAFDSPKYFEEDFLCEVFGFFFPAGGPQAKPENFGRMFSDQLCPCSIVSPAAPFNQAIIGFHATPRFLKIATRPRTRARLKPPSELPRPSRC